MHYLGICWRDKGKTEKLNTLAGVPVETGGTWTEKFCITNGYLIRSTAQPIAVSTDLYLGPLSLYSSRQSATFYGPAVWWSSCISWWFRTDRLESHYGILTLEPVLINLNAAVNGLFELQLHEGFSSFCQVYVVVVQWKCFVRSNSDCLLSSASNRQAEREEKWWNDERKEWRIK
jgi:hypothetical protein